MCMEINTTKDQMKFVCKKLFFKSVKNILI